MTRSVTTYPTHRAKVRWRQSRIRWARRVARRTGQTTAVIYTGEDR